MSEYSDDSHQFCQRVGSRTRLNRVKGYITYVIPYSQANCNNLPTDFFHSPSTTPTKPNNNPSPLIVAAPDTPFVGVVVLDVDVEVPVELPVDCEDPDCAVAFVQVTSETETVLDNVKSEH